MLPKAKTTLTGLRVQTPDLFIWTLSSYGFVTGHKKCVLYSSLQYSLNKDSVRPVPVAARSKACLCGRSRAEILGSNPAKGMDVCLLSVLSVVRYRGLCDGLITRPE